MKTNIEIIKQAATPMLLLEIEEVFCNLDEQDFEEAFRIVSDRSDEEGWEYLKIPCRRVHIALGEYVEISPEQIAECGGNARPWDFQYKGKRYQWAGIGRK